jgi:CBS domain-containing protein
MIKNIEDIMTENVITVFEGTPLAEAAMILTKHNFNGLPVVDKAGKVVGLFAERNMVSERSYSHLNTLLKLFSELEFYKKDNSPIREDLKNLMALKVKSIMTANPAVIHPQDSVEQAVALFANPANNPLLVVDEQQLLKGVVSMSDLTKLYGVPTKHVLDDKNVDQQIENFVQKFEQQFVVVSKTRANMWLIVSISFALIGFAVAMFLIVRVSA